MTTDELWARCVEPGIDRATQESRATDYIDAVLALDEEAQRAEVYALVGGVNR